MEIVTKRQRIQELEEANRRLVQIQELLVDNILVAQERDATYTGNRYKVYADAVVEVANKYAGAADWGVLQVGNIVDLRSSYIIGQGIKIAKTGKGGGDAGREYDFAHRFIEVNGLDHELTQDLAREAEIEGKTLLKIFPYQPQAGAPVAGFEGLDIALRWVSWTTNKYTVKVNPNDYLQLERVTWEQAGSGLRELLPPVCVYKRFAGRLDIPNETMPRVAKCLTQIENLDRALRDWRKINNLFAAPTPHVQCADATEAKNAHAAMLDTKNFVAGKMFFHTGTFGYAQPSSDGQRAIELEIITLMKLISGTTGVPIHFLGAPELTTKYGAANEGLLELIAMSTAKEREIWRGAYQELLTKAMLLWNSTTKKTPLVPERITVELPVVTEAQWSRLVDVWLPMRASGEITRETFLAQVPGLDVEAELKGLEENAAEAESKLMGRGPAGGEEDEEDEEDEE